MAGIAAGRLRHSITIERPIEGRDPCSGAVTQIWKSVCCVRAAIEPLSARDLIAAQAHQSEVTCRVVVRAREGLLPTMRIRHAGRYLYPVAWLPDIETGNSYLTAPCGTGVRREI